MSKTTDEPDYIAIGETLRRVYTLFAALAQRTLIRDLQLYADGWGTDEHHTNLAIAALVNAGWLHLIVLRGGLGVGAGLPLHLGARAEEYEAIARKEIHTW